MDFIHLWLIHGTFFIKIFRYIWIEKHGFFHIYFQVVFSDDFLGLNLGVWDSKTKYLARGVLQKSTFAQIGFLMIPGTIFRDFGWLRDQFSWLLMPWGLA